MNTHSQKTQASGLVVFEVVDQDQPFINRLYLLMGMLFQIPK
jgi:hypothetical protein